jgi:hypothetical protein
LLREEKAKRKAAAVAKRITALKTEKKAAKEMIKAEPKPAFILPHSVAPKNPAAETSTSDVPFPSIPPGSPPREKRHLYRANRRATLFKMGRELRQDLPFAPRPDIYPSDPPTPSDEFSLN